MSLSNSKLEKVASDDLATLKKVDHSPSFLQRSKSEANLGTQIETEHDSYFNHRKKASYETHLSELFLQHLTPFMPIVNKVSSLIINDIRKVMHYMQEEVKEQDIATSLNKKMHDFFSKDFDLNFLFSNPTSFYADILLALNSTSPSDFYKQMCIQRTFITFFTEKGMAKPEMHQAIAQEWCSEVNLINLLTDTVKFRKDSIYFKNNHRLPRTNTEKKTSENIGILPPEDYDKLLLSQKLKLVSKLPTHNPGMLQFFMTTRGDFAAQGMLDYDMPQICGPSGMTAMRLALSNQANLDKNEKQLIGFAFCLYHVSIGAHTIDECFSIANDTEFNEYLRGNYHTIVPEIIKTDPAFATLWREIQNLNNEYREVLQSAPVVESYLSRRT